MKYFMFTMLALGLGLQSSLRADDTQFNQHKAEIIKEIDERIQKIQDHKNCVSAATNHDALKQCRDKMKAWHETEKQQHMERRKSMIDQRIQKLQEEKAKVGTPVTPSH